MVETRYSEFPLAVRPPWNPEHRIFTRWSSFETRHKHTSFRAGSQPSEAMNVAVNRLGVPYNWKRPLTKQEFTSSVFEFDIVIQTPECTQIIIGLAIGPRIQDENNYISFERAPHIVKFTV